MPPEFRSRSKIWFSIAIVSVLFVSILITQRAAVTNRDNRTQAANCSGTLTLRPNGNVYVGLWALVPSVPAYQNVDDTGSGDGDATYIWDDTSPTNTLSFSHPNVSSGGISIASITVNERARLGQGSNVATAPGLQIGGTYYFAPGSYVTSSYVLYSYTWATNPATGTAWTVAAVNSANIAAASKRSAQGNHLNITQMWMDVCYNYLAPTADIKANASNGPITISYNSPATISWSSTDATSCSVSPTGWTGTSGSISSGNLTSAKTYTLTCTGLGGTSSDSVLVNVGSPPAPAPKPSPRPTPSPTPAPSQASTDIVVSFAPTPYLKNKVSVTLNVVGTTLSKTFDLDPGGGSISLSNNSVLAVNSTYTLKATTKNSLSQSINFKYGANTTVSVGGFIPGDFNRDNQVDTTDINDFINKGVPKQDNLYDVNADGVVNSVDYSLVLGSLGKKGS